jgi:hypothetical protein
MIEWKGERLEELEAKYDKDFKVSKFDRHKDNDKFDEDEDKESESSHDHDSFFTKLDKEQKEEDDMRRKQGKAWG